MIRRLLVSSILIPSFLAAQGTAQKVTPAPAATIAESAVAQTNANAPLDSLVRVHPSSALTQGSTPRPAPFAFADFIWLNGNSRQSSSVLDSNSVAPATGRIP